MAETKFIRFFDKLGNDMNLGLTYSVSTSLYTGATASVESFQGSINFPKVSVGLIESLQIFLLQEVTGPTSSFSLRKVKGTAITVGGNPTVTGSYSDFSALKVGNNIKIGVNNYTVTHVTGATSMTVSPTPSSSITTEDIYYYDYVGLNQLRSSPDTFNETVNFSISNEQVEFFGYNVNYDEDFPIIERFFNSDYEEVNGYGDSIDTLTGRVIVPHVVTLPTQINLGFVSGPTATYDSIYEEPLNISLQKSYIQTLIASPYINLAGNTVFTIGGTSHNLLTTTSFYLEGATQSGGVSFYQKILTPVSASISGSNTLLEVKTTDVFAFSSFSNYRIMWQNIHPLVTFNLYAETEAEDERFKLVLENFGKKVDFDKEYIFRESDIDEDLPNYTILNKKRKEMLLEGDNIYPYLGSYRALINIINFFGYYDLAVKEYFLNVDSNSINYGKYLHVLVPRDKSQREQVRTAWELLPSTTYKKTSLFGLFYNLNATNGEYDEYGVPIVTDSFDFSPEEVLIKLYGLKELLKTQFLPLNARIYDITGEGIYFRRIRLDAWSDNLNHLEVFLGHTPTFNIYPEGGSYVTDIRRMDQFYIDKFTTQGLTGFVGLNVSDPSITANTYSSSISSLYNTYLDNYEFFYENAPYSSVVDDKWFYLPPGISDPDYNTKASMTLPLPDDDGILARAPILLEAFFDITWEELTCSWVDLAMYDINGTALNITHWSWQGIGKGEFLDLRWVVEKPGTQGFFYDSGRLPIDSFLITDDNGNQRYLNAIAVPYDGIYRIGLYLFDITNNISMHFKNYKVMSWNIDFVSITERETPEKTWEDFSRSTDEILWNDVTGPWYYPLHIGSSWKDAETSWESLGMSSYDGTSLYELPLSTSILEINRDSEYVVLQGDLSNTPKLSIGDYLFFYNENSDRTTLNLSIPVGSFGSFVMEDSGIALMSGSIGSDIVYTDGNPTGFVYIGDDIWIQGNWYNVIGVNTTSLQVQTPLKTDFLNTEGLYYPKNGQLSVSYIGTPGPMVIYSRLLVTDNSNIDNLIYGDYYKYFDNLNIDTNNSRLTLTGYSSDIKDMMVKNSYLGDAIDMYMSWGLFAGDFAVKITGVKLTGNNTQFNLNDDNKFLYNIDGSFSIRLADYDVDYAMNRIGINSLTYENLNETSWKDDNEASWFGKEWHSGALCGFVIPFVTSNGSITIDEYPSFSFDGNGAIENTKNGLIVAANELNSSNNEGIKKYNYSVLPNDDLFLKGTTGSIVTTTSETLPGSGTIEVSELPINLKIPGSLSAVMTTSGDQLDGINVESTGNGYIVPPIVTIDPPSGIGTCATAICVLNSDSQIDSIVLTSPGSGYTSVPNVYVEAPQGYKALDEYLWTGYEWVNVVGVSISPYLINLSQSSTIYGIPSGTSLLIPYEYHKQQLLSPNLIQQFYYFIHVKAVNPSEEMLSYITLEGGVEGEWLKHPDKTYTYPLKNDILYSGERQNLSLDFLYNKWIYEGEDYPSMNSYPLLISDKKSNSSRAAYAKSTQQALSFIDTTISSQQQRVSKSSPVIFSYDKCKIPGKTKPFWTITNEDTGEIEVITNEKKFMWNFTKYGNFTVSLTLEDSNGNVASGKKNSFIIV